MKIYELKWKIFDGEHEYAKSEIRVFRNLKEAEKYGLIEEYANNTEKRPARAPGEKQLSDAREKACWRFGCSYRFNGANELNRIEGEDGFYRLILGGRLQDGKVSSDNAF